MKKYLQFIIEKLSDNQEKYINLVINYLKKNADFDLFEYSEEFEVFKKNYQRKLIGKLFLIPKDRAVRFNFDKDRMVSIDMWNNFKFDFETIINKPDYTMDIEDSIVSILDDIVDFINGDFEIVEKLKDEPEIKIAEDENVNLNSFKINKKVLDDDINIFESIKLYTMQVAYKISNSLVISGLPGLGKSWDVEETLNNMRIDYISVSGDITTSGLYEILFLNRNKLILFDDIDSIFDSKESINLLKAVLDTKPKRKVSRILKTHFDSFNMTDDEIQSKYEETGKLPKQFEFTGRIIFITNRPGDELDPALISRSLFVDVNLNIKQIIQRIKSIIPNIQPRIPIEKKIDILNFMIDMSKHFELRFPLNLRTFIHCLNIRIANEFNVTINGETVPQWQRLIKQYLIKK
ncbi:MAG: AAA family ATPase [Ignavibacteria bacterium]|nr:AAA family ATPase [Ignavibacteria bacterium]